MKPFMYINIEARSNSVMNELPLLNKLVSVSDFSEQFSRKGSISVMHNDFDSRKSKYVGRNSSMSIWTKERDKQQLTVRA